MQTKLKSKKNFKFSFFAISEDFYSRLSFIDSISKSIRKSEVGYAGFARKKYLKKYLKNIVFDNYRKKTVEKFHFDEKSILGDAKLIIKKCLKTIPSEPLCLFFFPTFNSFIKEKMHGVAGFCPRKNAVILFIYPKKYKRQYLKEAICHEYNHSIVHKYHIWKTLLDSIIFEGLAENFRMNVMDGKISPWAGSISAEESHEVYKKIKLDLLSKNIKLYRELFFGSNKFPIWAGYAIGFNIVKSFLSKNPHLTWKNIIKLKPQEILKRSDWE